MLGALLSLTLKGHELQGQAGCVTLGTCHSHSLAFPHPCGGRPQPLEAAMWIQKGGVRAAPSQAAPARGSLLVGQ